MPIGIGIGIGFGGGRRPAVTVSPRAQAVAAGDVPSLTVTWAGVAHRDVYLGGVLLGDYDSGLVYFFDTAGLDPGTYTLTFSIDSPDGPAGSARVTVAAPATPRVLEDGTARVLEDGTPRLLEA